MNKTFKSILALALMAVAMVFASCSKDDDNDPVVPSQQEIETKIIGKWKEISKDGVTLLTNDRAVTTFYADKTETVSLSTFMTDLDVHVWELKARYTWSVERDVVCIKPMSSIIGVTLYNKVVELGDSHYSYIVTSAIDAHGVEHKPNNKFDLQKVTADYSQDIIGMWEGVEMTGYETYGDAHHRIEYRADGTYTYYSWDEAPQAWKPLEDVFDEYNVDGDWLATRWQNNGSDVMNYEWWDIDYIKDGIMKWSALREKEDGERFTTTFTWKKVK